jgi:hypothetical protein
MALIDSKLDVCLGSPWECAIRIPEEVSSKMICDLANSLKLIATASELLKEEVRMMHNTSQVVHINANKLIMSATVLHPNIRISLAGVESHVH